MFSRRLMYTEGMGRKRLPHPSTALIVLTVLSTALLAPPRILFGNPQAAPPEKVTDQDLPEIRQALSIAEAQHEKVMVLISQGRFDRVLPEVKTLLDLKLPPKYDSKVAESACIIANGLAENKQYSLGHTVLDEALRRMRENKDKVAILKINAFIYKTEGNLDMALRCLDRAIELEKTGR